jgi:tRNA (guanine-N7-)-methyltransferase
MTETENKRKPIRSFVLRRGRMTFGQQRALESGLKRWGLKYDDGEINADMVFAKSAPVVLEIGFGMGQSLVEMAAAAPERNFIGIEVHTPGVGRLLHDVEDRGLQNIRVYYHDAVEILRDCIPWHKKKHNKRRLIQPGFVANLVPKIKTGGVLHLATDWENYAQQMMVVLTQSKDFENLHGREKFAPRPESRPLTKFEKRGERLGHGVWDLLFERVS